MYLRPACVGWSGQGRALNQLAEESEGGPRGLLENDGNPCAEDQGVGGQQSR